LFEENFRSRIVESESRSYFRGVFIHELKNWTYFNWDKDLNAVLHHVKTRRDNLLDKVGKLSDQKRKQMIYHVSKNVKEAEQKYTRKLDTKNQRIHLLERTVSIISDATKNCEADVTTERLQRWNSGLYRDGFISPEIKAGEWRTIPVTVSIQENIVFRGPTPERIPNEMKKFLSWINSDPEDTDKLLQAGIAHFWFLVIHPFRDGNGRIARAITEMMLSRADRQRERFYSFATQMQNDRGTYQGYLIAASKGSQNLTVWLFWFLCAIDDALKESEEIFGKFKD
jgi:Fic family protein